ncbi:MAG: class I SAM-dependent methyltransferase [Candidatus Methanofastidiosa archaeon]|nr:class I SAM-dependent methyltransferase [Candidatus Methanofastidiosa archaeon]
MANILDTTFENNYFDIVISERCLLNLPSKESQFQMIKRIWEILKPDGIYVMVEGSYDGLIRLNEIRKLFGLKEIPDKDENNFSSLKFVEKELENYVINYFDISKKHFFGMYYFISRVIHPLLVYPEEPKFESRINEIARLISSKIPNYEDIGHIVGYVLSARKNIK